MKLIICLAALFLSIPFFSTAQTACDRVKLNDIPLDLATYQKDNYFIKLITKENTIIKSVMRF